MRGLVELSGHVGILLGHLGVALLHARRGLQQGRRSHGLDVADGQHRVAVTGEDDLALLGELEAALDGTDRLGEHRAVGGAAATTYGTAAAMEQGQIDVVRLSPLGDALLSGVQGQRGGGRAGVLRGVGVTEHDLELVAGGLQTSLNLGDLDHFLEHVHRVLQILKLLEQRDHVDGGHVLRVGEGQAVELVDILDVLGALGEGDDVAAGGLEAVALLDGTEGAEGVEHLVRHRLQFAALAVQTVLADIRKGAGMHHGVLTELHLHHVEAEGLGLPDQILQRAVSGTLGTGGGQRTLDHLEVGEEVVAGVVHEVGVALDGVVQTVGHHQHDRAVHLLGGDQGGLVGQTLAYFLLVAPEALELGARRRGLGFHREVAAHGAGGLLKGGDHVIGELAGHGAAHLGGDVRVTVAVGADPAARVEERGASGLDETGLIAQDPVVEATVDLGDGVEQRVVEDVENRVRFLNRGRLLQRDRRGAEQGVDLVVETAQAFLLIRAAEALVLLKQFGNAANLAFHGLTTGLSGVRREDGVEFELVEQFLGLGRASLIDELVVSDGELVDRVDRLVNGHVVLALVEHGNAVVLLGQVCQMEIRGERAGQQLGVVQRHVVDDVHGLLQAILVGVRILQLGEMLGAGLHRVMTHGVERRQQFGVVFAQYVTQDLKTQIHVVLQAFGKIMLLRALSAGPGSDDGGVSGSDLFFRCCHITSFAE